MSYKVGSLFAGVGGIDLGFMNATFSSLKYQIVWANEIDEYAVATYQHNFKQHPVIPGDIEKIVRPEREEDLEIRSEYYHKREEILQHQIDVLVGGFPCQAFSIAGYRKGFDDERGNLFWSIVDLINLFNERHGKPSVLLLENVKNLKNHDNGRTYNVIKNELEKLGYTVKEQVINTKDVTNLPQNRERIYIVAFLDEEVAKNFTMFDNDNIKDYKIKISEEKRKENIAKVLNLDLKREDLDKYYYTKDRYPGYFMTEKEYLVLDESNRKEHRVNIDEEINEAYEFYQVRRGMYVRKNQNGVCPTLTANMGTGGHNVPLIKVSDGVRKLTPAETFKLQGFPIGNGYELPTEFKGRAFSDGRLYKQAGNAVSVDVSLLIAKEILKALDTSNNNVEKELIHNK